MSNLIEFVNMIRSGGSFNGTTPYVQGVSGTFGSPEILGIAGILIILIIGMKMKASPDLIMISSICLVEILVSGLPFPSWVQWIFLIPAGVIFSLGLIKVIKHR